MRIFPILAVVLFVGVMPAHAQSDQASGPVVPDRSYKLLREDEGWSFLRDPALRRDFWDPINYIPLRRSSDDWYLTMSGEAREVWNRPITTTGDNSHIGIASSSSATALRLSVLQQGTAKILVRPTRLRELWVGLWVGKMARTLLSSYCESRPIESDLKLVRRPYCNVIHVSAWRRCLSQKCADKKMRVCGGYRKMTARIPVHSNRWLIPDVTPRIALSGNQ